MDILRPASEDEVIAAFLCAEIESERFGGRLAALLEEDAADSAIVREPDLDDPVQNAYRYSLLDRHRRWGAREGLFGGLPAEIEWSLAWLRPEEVLAIKYIDWDFWRDFSGGTRDPTEAARRIRAGTREGDDPAGWEPAAARLASDRPSPPLIVVAEPDRAKLVLVEGHIRLTAYALHPRYLPERLAVYLGTSPAIDEWWAF